MKKLLFILVITCLAFFLQAQEQIDFDVSTPPDVFFQIARNASINTEKTPIYLNKLKQVATSGESGLYLRKTIVKDTVTLQTYYTTNDKDALTYRFINRSGDLLLNEIKAYSEKGNMLCVGRNLHRKRSFVMFKDGFRVLMLLYKEGMKQKDFYYYEGASYNGLHKVSALFRHKLAYGIIDDNGEVIIPVEYTELKNDKEIFMVSNLENKYGVLDRKGISIIPCLYDKIYIKENFLQVQNGQSYPDWKFGLYTRSGRVVVSIGKEFLLDFDANDLSYVQADNGKYGYINKAGDIVLRCEYFSARPFREGLAAVENEQGKFGFINTQGMLVIPYKYSSVSGNFYKGQVHIKEGRKSYFIDKMGNKVK